MMQVVRTLVKAWAFDSQDTLPSSPDPDIH